MANEQTIRGVAVGSMVLAGVGAGWVFFVGSFFRGVAPEDSLGSVLMVAGAVGLVSAVVVAHGVIVGVFGRVALAALVQAVVAVALLVWWETEDFWDGTRHAGLASLLLVALLLVDVLIALWANHVRASYAP